MSTKKTSKVAAVKKKPATAKPLAKAQHAKKTAKAVKKIAAPKPAKAATSAAKDKNKKLKVVRDSFTMPQNEYQKIALIKAQCMKAGLQVKKSEVLRAGVIALCAMSDAHLVKAMSGLDKIKTGRPNKR
jgi:hypothetical protein